VRNETTMCDDGRLYRHAWISSWQAPRQRGFRQLMFSGKWVWLDWPLKHWAELTYQNQPWRPQVCPSATSWPTASWLCMPRAWYHWGHWGQKLPHPPTCQQWPWGTEL
jgi:hypothetical protein